MALNIVYPSPAVMKEIESELTLRDRADRIGLQLFPVVQEPTYHVRWVQRDNYYGLQQMRGLDGLPPHVQRLGQTTFVYEPGVYGEHTSITEREILTRAAFGNTNLPIPISDLVMRDQTQLIQREDDRMEANVWTLLGTGTLSIPLPGPNGTTVYNDTYTTQTVTASVPWATSATAVPIADFQRATQLGIGHGVDLGSGATAYANSFTINLLLNNSNAADYGGRRSQYGATLNTIAGANDYFRGQNLPQLVPYDAGYQLAPLAGPVTSASTQFTKFIPDHTVIVVGKRPSGQPIGNTVQTIQAMEPGASARPGGYNYVTDSTRGLNTPMRTPPKIEIHRGWNGGLVLYYPSAVVVLTV